MDRPWPTAATELSLIQGGLPSLASQICRPAPSSISANEGETGSVNGRETEQVGPRLLAFAEAIEQPVFNLFYPCGLPFQELDDYP